MFDGVTDDGVLCADGCGDGRCVVGFVVVGKNVGSEDGDEVYRFSDKYY